MVGRTLTWLTANVYDVHWRIMSELEKLDWLKVGLIVGIRTDLQKLSSFLSIEDECIYILCFAVQWGRGRLREDYAAEISPD